MILPWQNFAIPALALVLTICRTFLSASIAPTKPGRESLAALDWASRSPDGLPKCIEVPSKFKVVRVLGRSFVCVYLFFKGRQLQVGSPLRFWFAYMGHSGCYAMLVWSRRIQC